MRGEAVQAAISPTHSSCQRFGFGEEAPHTVRYAALVPQLDVITAGSDMMGTGLALADGPVDLRQSLYSNHFLPEAVRLAEKEAAALRRSRCWLRRRAPDEHAAERNSV